VQLSAERNLEKVDGHPMDCGCKCGWAGPLLGLHARQHWVEPWDFEEETAAHYHRNSTDGGQTDGSPN
jgi:hypothetical protein